MGTYNPKLPTRATGTDKYITFFVTRNRQPTLADYRQPETGTNYSLGTVWQVAKNPTTGLEGDLWMLSKIVANQGYWIQIASGGVGPILTIQGDVGSMGGNTVTIYADQAALGCGSSVLFTDGGSVSTLTVTDAKSNTLIGQNAGTLSVTGNRNTGLGMNLLSSLTTGNDNTILGYNAGNLIDSQGYNVIVGSTAAQFNNESFNTVVGYNALGTATSANNNICIGNAAGVNLLTNESFNIYVGNQGLAAESNVTRIGTQESMGVGQDTCFIAGIIGNTVSNMKLVTIDNSTGQLGITSGGSFGETITPQSGGALPPTAGNWNIYGASTVAGTNPVITTGTGSTLTVNVQKSQAIASTDVTKVGLSAFDSGSFAVDANGFVSLLSNTTISTGTWTPTVVGASVAGTTTYVDQNGQYLKIGKFVFLSCQMSISTSTGTGDALFGGLPFACEAVQSYYGSALISSNGHWPLPTGATYVTSQVINNTSTVKFDCLGSTLNNQFLQMDNAGSDNCSLHFFCMYMTA